MRIKVQITLESGGGQSETLEVARLERGSLQPDTLGLSLAEARAILAGLEQTLVEGSVATFSILRKNSRPHDFAKNLGL